MDGEVELLGERIAEQAAHLDAATHRLLADLREFDMRGGWHRQGAQSCAHWLSWRVGWDLVTARDRVRVARKLGEFPATDDTLRRGELSYSKVRAILRVATPANEAMLLECARLSTASQLDKLSRKYARVQAHGKEVRPRDDEQRRYVRRRDTDDGMVKIEAVLHPEEAELVWAMLDHAAKQLTRGPYPRPARGDSAESRIVADLTSSTDDGPGTVCPTRDSAESRLVADLASSAHDRPGAVCPIDDSAEAPAMSDITAVSGAYPGARPATEHAAASPEPAPVRPPSGLRQAADAAERAFNRADALLAIVQGYLRGDRPNRAPVDVMLTIPVSDLREGAADPAEVGRQCLGASCLAAETARRLSCDAGVWSRGNPGAAPPDVIEVVEDVHGVPLSVGRKRRTIAGSIKRALLKRDTACTYPGFMWRAGLRGGEAATS